MTWSVSITLGSVLALLLLYAALYVVARTYHHGTVDPQERRTFWVIALGWAFGTFVANYLLFRAGLMSFLPWANNFLHTFVWIGGVLSILYLGVRRSQPLWMQMVLYATFSLVIKVGEQILFGTWEHPHFFHVFRGNAAYVLGWSLADGLYPPITLYVLRLLHRRGVPGLLAV